MDKQNILLVDDRVENLIALEAILEAPDRTLVRATSGNEALAEVLKRNFALVLLDVQMPEMDGFEVAELMRKNKKSRSVPIIFVTAISKEQKYVFKGYECGAVDYLFKPLDQHILISKVNFFLELDKKNQELEKRYNEVIKLKEDNEILLKSVGEGVIGLNDEGLITFVNPAANKIFGSEIVSLIGLNIAEILFYDEHANHPFKWQGSPAHEHCEKGESFKQDDGVYGLRDGKMFPVEYIATPIIRKNQQRNGAVVALSDITQRKQTEMQLFYSARYDTLTGLANRDLFEKVLHQAIARAQRNNTYVGLMFLDLDRFKQVNDTLGHNVGDMLLQEVAQRLNECIRESDTIARLGGDEFTFVIESINDPVHINTVAEKVLKTLGNKFYLVEDDDEHEINIGASIGIVNYPNSAEDVNALLKCADIAMYHAKSLGRNNYQIFSANMQDEISASLNLENKLRNGLENKEFKLVYQPQIDLDTGHIIGVEALMRWQPKDEELQYPGVFIPIAEESGLIVPLGKWLLKEACEQASKLHKLNITHDPLIMSVNLSVRQLVNKDLQQTLTDTLNATSLDPKFLNLEITESMVMDNAEEKIEALNEMRQTGLKISIDDFGTGFSSLVYVKDLPIDALKIDRTFVKDIGIDHQCEAIINAVLGIGKSLGLEVIAEGVETLQQLEYLKENGCHAVQGFYYSKPLEIEELIEVLRENYNKTHDNSETVNF